MKQDTRDEGLPLSSDALLDQLRAWAIPFTLHEHVPLRTVEEAKSVEAGMLVPGQSALRLKNLYLRDRKKRNYLVSLEQDRAIDLKALAAEIGTAGLSFGSESRLMEFLGVRPGAVTPLAMINGVGKDIQFFIDKSLQDHDAIYMHPLVNYRTVAMEPEGFDQFMAQIGATPRYI